MIKRAVVEIGKTPSIISGKVSETIKSEEAICKDESLKSNKIAKFAMEKIIKLEDNKINNKN